MPFDHSSTHPAADDDDDDALMARFANGDQSAARALTLRLLPGALALARRMLGDEAEAEDTAQEAMLRLWKQAPAWEPGRAKASTWLYTVVQNLCRDRLRRRGRVEHRAEPPELPDENTSALEMLMADDRARALRASLCTLPERQQTALHLKFFEELTNIEIAAVMETTVEAVESLLGRGKRALANNLRNSREALNLS